MSQHDTALEKFPRTCGSKMQGLDAYCKNPAGLRTNHAGTGPCWLHEGLLPVASGRYAKVERREILDLLKQLEADTDPLNLYPDLLMVRALMMDFLNRYEENRDAVLAWHASWNGRPWRTDDLVMLKEVMGSYEARMREDGTWDPGDGEILEERVMLERAQDMVRNMEEAFTHRPREVLDIADAYRMASEATKIVERIEKIRARGAISQADFARVMTELGRGTEAALSPSKVRSILLKHGVSLETVPEAEVIAIADDLRNTLVDLWMTIRVA